MMRHGELVLVALALLLRSADAETSASQTHSRGVTVSTYRLENAYRVCLTAKQNTRIAAEYGVEFTVPPGERKLWKEPFPKLVTGKQPYFDLPASFELASVDSQLPRHIKLHLGICVDAVLCDPIDIPITISPATEITSDQGCR
jgi:hypothetical protein